MGWQQLHIAADGDQARRLQNLLENAGAAAVTLRDAGDEPLLEPAPGAMPLWRDTIVTALFPADRDPDALIAEIERQFGASLPDSRVEVLADQAWERSWMDDFQPLRFGERLWIVPSWCEASAPEAVNLRLDPGLAFGTGTHETTALCLEWLDAHPPAGQRVLDYGCGSGVLAIAALLLGAERADVCDLDAQALTATRANAETNGVSERLFCHDLKTVPGSADLMLANILAGPLMELAPHLAELIRPGGSILLSGILREQAPEVCHHYRPWFELEAPVERGDWCLLTGIRRQAE